MIAFFNKYKYVLLLITIGFFIYCNSLINNLVWDDIIYIINNLQVHSINISLLFSNSNLFNTPPYYRPILTLYISSLFVLFQNNAFFYHITQLLLHTANSILVFYLFKIFFKEKLSFFLALLFLVHPMNVESVSIMSSGSVLYFFFGILALLISRDNIPGKNKSIILFLLLLLSVFSKESGFLFIFIIVLFQFLFKKRNLGKSFVLGTAITFFYFVLHLWIGNTYFAKLQFVPIMRLSLTGRLINIPLIILYYLKTFLLPVSLATDQQWIVRSIDIGNFYFPLLIIILFTASVVLLGLYIYTYRKQFFHTFVFFSLWFLIGIILLLQITPLDGTVADRWFYFPMVGLLGLLGVATQSISIKNKNIYFSIVMLGTLVIIAFSARTIIRNVDWRSNLSLYSHDAGVSDNYALENNLGNEFIVTKDYDQALLHFNKSIQLAPENDLKMWENLGLVYHYKKNTTLAKKYYEKAIITNHSQEAYENLSNLLLSEKDISSAKKVASEGLKYHPASWLLWMWLSISEYKLGNLQEALSEATKAYNLSANENTFRVLQNMQNKLPLEMNW